MILLYSTQKKAACCCWRGDIQTARTHPGSTTFTTEAVNIFYLAASSNLINSFPFIPPPSPPKQAIWKLLICPQAWHFQWHIHSEQALLLCNSYNLLLFIDCWEKKGYNLLHDMGNCACGGCRDRFHHNRSLRCCLRLSHMLQQSPLGLRWLLVGLGPMADWKQRGQWHFSGTNCSKLRATTCFAVKLQLKAWVK